MAVTRETLRLTSSLRNTVGAEADTATRDITKAWSEAWDGLDPRWTTAAGDLVALQTELGRWPQPVEVRRLARVRAALNATQAVLSELDIAAIGPVAAASGAAVSATAEAEPRIIASQLPAGERSAAAKVFAAALAVIAVEQLASAAVAAAKRAVAPIAAATFGLLQRVLTTDQGQSTAHQVADRVRAAFAGGLTTAIVAARSAPFGGYRATAQASHEANRDVVTGWAWTCRLSLGSCAACWVMHGTVHPLSEAGPLDHPQGRCMRTAIIRPWAEIGYRSQEPPSVAVGARERFDALDEESQVAILGAGRLALLRAGKVAWADLATRRVSGGHVSHVPTSVAELRRLAG